MIKIMLATIVVIWTIGSLASCATHDLHDAYFSGCVNGILHKIEPTEARYEVAAAMEYCRRSWEKADQDD